MKKGDTLFLIQEGPMQNGRILFLIQERSMKNRESLFLNQKELAQNGLFIKNYDEISPELQAKCDKYFFSNICTICIVQGIT